MTAAVTRYQSTRAPSGSGKTWWLCDSHHINTDQNLLRECFQHFAESTPWRNHTVLEAEGCKVVRECTPVFLHPDIFLVRTFLQQDSAKANSVHITKHSSVLKRPTYSPDLLSIVNTLLSWNVKDMTWESLDCYAAKIPLQTSMWKTSASKTAVIGLLSSKIITVAKRRDDATQWKTSPRPNSW